MDSGLESIYSRLERIREELRYLKTYERMPYDVFVSDFEHFKTAERCLEVAIQACVDVAAHLIGRLDLRKPARSGDTFAVLAEERMIPQPLADDLARMVGFRNILVHEYLQIRLDIGHELIQTRLSDIETFVRSMAAAADRLEGMEKQEAPDSP